MKARRPLLRLIHISDLHMCNDYSDKQMLATRGMEARLYLMNKAEEHDLHGWNAGVAGHKPSAERAFERYLQAVAGADDEWSGGVRAAVPETWLINTGDVSALGDTGSIDYALARFAKWSGMLGGCPSRCLFGNHDVWPGIQPLVLAGIDKDLGRQSRELVASKPPWRCEEWLQPLVVSAPQGGPTIEFYALNTISFARLDNYSAVGEVSPDDLEALCVAVESRAGKRAYRILGTHHPVVFPYASGENSVGFMQSMVLRNATGVIRRLKNENGMAPGLGIQPYVHLFLSGHTHFGYPGERLLADVGECYQGELGPRQLQLVAGSLMQSRDIKKVRANYLSRLVDTEAPGFAQTRLLDANNQFQVLRFYYHEDQPNQLELERDVMVSNPNDVSGFTVLESMTSTTYVLM